MIDLIENYESFYTTENDKRFSLKISDDFYDFLAYRCVLFIKDNLFDDTYSVNFNLTSLKKHIYLCEVDISETKALDTPLKFSDVTALFNSKIGLNIAVVFSGLSINFPIFTIKRKYKINKNFFSDLLKKRNKIKENNNIIYNDNLEIKYFDDFICKYEENEYRNISFYIIIEKKLSILIQNFFISFCNNFDNFRFKVFNPIIYFENNQVEDNIFFRISNAPVEKFRISFIQNRLFFIIKEKNKLKLIINYIYIHSDKNNKTIHFIKQKNTENNKHKIYYNKDDNVFMLNRYLLAEYDLNKQKTIFYI